MKRFIAIAVLLVLGLLAGCRTFSGNVIFENEGDRPVWVADVDGFKRLPSPGILGKGASAGLRMDPMPIPKEVTIRWSYEWHHSDYTTRVSLEDIAMPGPEEELLFRFTKEAKWEVGIRRRK